MGYQLNGHQYYVSEQEQRCLEICNYIFLYIYIYVCAGWEIILEGI